MTRARHLAVLTLVAMAGWSVAPACGGQKAMDVTAPDKSSSGSGDWGDEPDEEATGVAGRSKSRDEETYDPCLQKKCGAPCTVCYPGSESCDEIQLLKECNLQGMCVVAPANCTEPEEETENK